MLILYLRIVSKADDKVRSLETGESGHRHLKPSAARFLPRIPHFVSAFSMKEPGVRRRVAQHMSPSSPNPGTSLLTRPSLLFRVREWNDSASWEEFHRLYRRLIYGRARRAGLFAI